MDAIKLQNAVKERYTEEAVSCSTLSCGSNLEYIRWKSDGVILDLGCGRGKETIYAAKKMPNGKAVGVDITEAMIEEAKVNLIRENLTNVEFMKGDIENLPLKDETFDYVISNCVINHAKNKQRAYSEIRRVLKSSGYFVISDPVTKFPLPQEIKNSSKEWADCFGGALTEEEYIESIMRAGFLKVEIINRREYIKKGYDFVSLTIKAWKNQLLL